MKPSWAGALLPLIAIACCTPNPRFTSTHYPAPLAEPSIAASEVSPPANIPSDTAAAMPQPESPPKKNTPKPMSQAIASDTAQVQSSWSSAFDEKDDRQTQPSFIESGSAVWYGPGFHGKKTASGERFDMNGYTAAHRTLPFYTSVKVTNLDNGLSVVVRINDRGPFDKKYCIDLSFAAAKKIGLDKTGAANVRIETAARP